MSIVNKPWGTYQTLYSESNYLIKKIVVNSNCKLSLQSHNYRSEYWTVIYGTGQCVIGDTIINISEGINIFIPQNILGCFSIRYPNLDIVYRDCSQIS